MTQNKVNNTLLVTNRTPVLPSKSPQFFITYSQEGNITQLLLAKHPCAATTFPPHFKGTLLDPDVVIVEASLR